MWKTLMNSRIRSAALDQKVSAAKEADPLADANVTHVDK